VFNRPRGPLARAGAGRRDDRAVPLRRRRGASASYIRFFFERGHPIALPRVTTLDKPMEFRLHSDPY
jgi:5-formyltetrahydrofolate cyclo-ligase